MEGGAEDCIVRIRGMPFSATQDDIREFFSGLNIVEDGIFIVYNSLGKPSGV